MNELSGWKMKLFKLVSFITSLFPLSLYIWLNNKGDTRVIKGLEQLDWLTVERIAIAQILVQLIALLIFFSLFMICIKFGTNINKTKYYLTDISKDKSNTTSYLLSNVLPIIAFDITTLNDLIFLAVLIIALAFMYIRNNLYYINPLYDILKINSYTAVIYKIDDDELINEENAHQVQIMSLINIYKNGTYIGNEFVDVLIIKEQA